MFFFALLDSSSNFCWCHLICTAFRAIFHRHHSSCGIGNFNRVVWSFGCFWWVTHVRWRFINMAGIFLTFVLFEIIKNPTGQYSGAKLKKSNCMNTACCNSNTMFKSKWAILKFLWLMFSLICLKIMKYNFQMKLFGPFWISLILNEPDFNLNWIEALISPGDQLPYATNKSLGAIS